MDILYIVIYSFTASITAWITWYLFYRPYNLIVDFTDLGYDGIDVSNLSLRKKKLVNFFLKRRKAGDLPPPYPNSWYSILRSDELKRKQVKELYYFGQNLVAWRGEESGQVYVADAYCPHLGAHLGVGGIVNGNCITCPFHQWSFDGNQNGEVVDVPYTKQDVIKCKLPGLNLWRAMESNGIIWIWYHNQNKDPTWFPQPFFEVEEKAKYYFHGRAVIKVTCHIQDMVENLADATHFDAVHSLPPIFPRRFTQFFGKLLRHNFTLKWTQNDDPKYKHESNTTADHFLEIFGGKFKCAFAQGKMRLIGAGIIFHRIESATRTLIIISTVTPIEPLLNQITQLFYFVNYLPHPLALVLINGEVQQLLRDVEIWNRKCFLNKPNLVKEDHLIKAYRRWYSQFYSRDEGNAQLTKQSYLGNCCENKLEF